ncbi:MAG: hypothetical protein AAF985_19725, partial [Bacteroidota bacterium]
LLQSTEAVVFVDSIHHLGLSKRLQLYRAKALVVLTSHWNRAWEYKLAGKTYLSFAFKGINKQQLLEIVKNRIAIAAIDTQTPIQIDEDQIVALIKKYKDNYRAILNHLYDVFQQQ